VAKEVAFDLRSTPNQMEVWGLVEGQDNLAKVAGWLAVCQRRRSDAVNAMDLKGEEWEVPKRLPKDAQYPVPVRCPFYGERPYRPSSFPLVRMRIVALSCTAS